MLFHAYNALRNPLKLFVLKYYLLSKGIQYLFYLLFWMTEEQWSSSSHRENSQKNSNLKSQ